MKFYKTELHCTFLSDHQMEFDDLDKVMYDEGEKGKEAGTATLKFQKEITLEEFKIACKELKIKQKFFKKIKAKKCTMKK